MTTESPEEVSYSNQIPEGISGRNPYSLSVMQQAVNSLLRTRSLDTIYYSLVSYGLLYQDCICGYAFYQDGSEARRH